MFPSETAPAAAFQQSFPVSQKNISNPGLQSPTLETEISELHNALNILDSVSESLVGALYSVSHSVPQATADAQKAAHSLPTALMEVRAATERVIRIGQVLTEARNRLAL
ncbi:hypothetical protein [Paraburkholderia bannensis]|uniref:hypothetical protein n=1 Tax=Paraburkholderia bannensis TaxID=765414 RepID=UPI000487A260|nr:hypothetical protein [Paraburkholderia bannensis]